LRRAQCAMKWDIDILFNNAGIGEQGPLRQILETRLTVLR
jgi:hypothetical protein